MINETFKNNLNSIGIELTDRQYEQFDMYYKLLVEWNSFMNLTGITDYEEVLLKHYVDSLVLDIEKIGHKEKLSLMYEEMKDETEEELQEVLSKAGDLDTQIDVNYEGFLDLRLKDRTIGYIKNLALRHDYRIPYITDSGSTGMLKLTLVQDDDNKGRISVNMLSSVLGKVSVEAKADRESLGMYIVSDTAVSDEGSQLLEDMEENLKEGFGFTNVTVNIRKSSDVPYVTYEAAADSVATDKLYEIAAQIVKLLAG